MAKIIAKGSYLTLSETGIIQVTGKNTAQFLQGQLTCDLNEINDKQSRLGAHCDAKGRILATFRLFSYQDAYYFILPRSMVWTLLQSLQKYAPFSAVTLTNVSENWQKIGLYGAQAIALLERQGLLAEKKGGLAHYKRTLSLTMPGSDSRFILLTPDTEPIAFIDASFSQGTLDHWYLFDIKAGIPTIYAETSHQFTPHQLNYPAIGGVSFNKGCYIGQEIIARTHYLGKSKSGLYRVAFQADKVPLPGTPLLQCDEKPPQGTLIMCAKEDGHDYQALVCLQNQAISHTIHLETSKGPCIKLLDPTHST